MEKRNIGIIATAAAAVLCGCPGIVLLCLGAMAVFGVYVPESEVSDPQTALIGAGVIACLGLIGIVVPIAVGFFTLREGIPASAEIIDINEPLPPAL